MGGLSGDELIEFGKDGFDGGRVEDEDLEGPGGFGDGRVDAELEGGDDAKVVAGAAEAPEEVGVRGWRGGDGCPIGEDQACAEELVEAQAVFAHQRAQSAAHTRAGDADALAEAGCWGVLVSRQRG